MRISSNGTHPSELATRGTTQSYLQACFPVWMTGQLHQDLDWRRHNAFVGQPVPSAGRTLHVLYGACHCTHCSQCTLQLHTLQSPLLRSAKGCLHCPMKLACRALWSPLMIAILNPAGATARHKHTCWKDNTPCQRKNLEGPMKMLMQALDCFACAHSFCPKLGVSLLSTYLGLVWTLGSEDRMDKIGTITKFPFFYLISITDFCQNPQ